MTEPHPFARYVAALGRGPGRARALDEIEAEDAMRRILAGEVEPVQLGAFLMLMRYKRESAAELAGFVRASRAVLAAPLGVPVELDWPSYADKHRQLPWFVLSALLLAENGVKILMHGIDGAEDGFAPTGGALAALGIAACETLAEAATRLAAANFAYVRIEGFCPPLAGLFALRPLLGLRSPVNSLARELNPLGAPNQVQGVFHPTYRPLHSEAALRLGQPRAAVFKGGAGEAQRNPDKPCLVEVVRDGAVAEAEWPALTPEGRYRWRDEPLDVGRIAALWRGEIDDPTPTAAITGTAAVALELSGRAADMGAAQAMAEAMWRDRPRAKYGAGSRLSA